VDAGLAAVGGFAGGYFMALGAYWLEAVFGLTRLDFGHTGLQYIGGEKPGWWAVGLILHLIDSVLLGLLYAGLVWPNLAAWGLPADNVAGSIAGGMAYGVVLWVVLAMLIAMPMMGAGVFGYETRSPRIAILSLGLHLAYGFLLGLIYMP
jgi:hypothetical protein